MSEKKLGKSPLSFHTKPYGGKNDKLMRDYMFRLKVTRVVEEYLNSVMTEEPQIKTVFEIAEATGYGEETFRRVLSENGHGYNGITY